MTKPTRRGRGQRPGSDTRAAILDAALEQFAAWGYRRATIRSIALQADVDPALIHHYFGTKRDLFEAAIRIPDEVLATIASTSRHSLDAREVLAGGLALWEQPDVRRRLTAIVRAGIADPDGQNLYASMVSSLVPQLAEAIGGPDADLRAQLAMSHAFGTAVFRYLFHIEPLATIDAETLIRLASPAFETYYEPHRSSRERPSD